MRLSETRHFDLARWLIKRGADFQAKDKKGSQPLHVAAQTGQLDLMLLFVAHGVSVSVKDQKAVNLSMTLHSTVTRELLSG